MAGADRERAIGVVNDGEVGLSDEVYFSVARAEAGGVVGHAAVGGEDERCAVREFGGQALAARGDDGNCSDRGIVGAGVQPLEGAGDAEPDDNENGRSRAHSRKGGRQRSLK